MDFTQVQAQKKMYTEWGNCAQDQMIARGFAPAGRTGKNFPDTDFLPICTGMRTLRPACNLIVSAVAANDMHRLEDIEEAVVELVKESCRKLNDTNNKGKMVVPNPAIPPGQVVAYSLLLPPGAPNQWEAATTIGNPCQLPPNAPPAHIPAGGQLGQAPPGAAGPNVPAAQVNVPAGGQLGQAPPGAACPNVPAAQVNVAAAGQVGQAPPCAAGPNVAAAGQLGQAPPGAAGPNIPAAQVKVAAAGQLGQAPPGAAGPNLPAAQVNVPAAGQLGQAPAGAAGPNVPAAQVNIAAAGQLGQAPPRAAGPNVPAAQVNAPAAGQLGQAPPVRLVQTYLLHKSTSLLRDNSDRRPWERLVQTSLLPDKSDRFPRVRLVQTYQLHKSTSLLADNWDRLLRVQLVQTYRRHRSTSPPPDNSDRLPRVMFLRRVRMYLFNLIMILRTHNWYVIQVHRIMTLCRRKCYLIHRIRALRQSKTNLLPGVLAGHPTVGPQGSHFLNHQPVSGFYLLTYEIQIGALYMGVRAPCLSFMSCRRDVVWHYPSLKGIR